MIRVMIRVTAASLMVVHMLIPVMTQQVITTVMRCLTGTLGLHMVIPVITLVLEIQAITVNGGILVNVAMLSVTHSLILNTTRRRRKNNRRKIGAATMTAYRMTMRSKVVVVLSTTAMHTLHHQPPVHIDMQGQGQCMQHHSSKGSRVGGGTWQQYYTAHVPQGVAAAVALVGGAAGETQGGPPDWDPMVGAKGPHFQAPQKHGGTYVEGWEGVCA